MLYYGTFSSGLQKAVSRLAAESGFSIVLELDGALMFETASEPFLPCFANVFAVLHYERHSAGTDGKTALAALMKASSVKPRAYGLSGGAITADTGKITDTLTAFRVSASVGNSLISADNNIKTRLERHIANVTGLTPDREGGGREFLFLYRNEGLLFILRRLTPRAAREKTPRKGELRPELAFTLNYMSKPAPGDTVLDPFCGHGAIPAARLKYFPCKAVFASDADARLAKTAESSIKSLAPSVTAVECRRAAVGETPFYLPARSVDKIVTDPPWGLYDGSTDIDALYARFAGLCVYLLKPGGVAVILTKRESPMDARLAAQIKNGLLPLETYDILVSGKKARTHVVKLT